MTRTIIGVSGYARHGKDTLAGMLDEYFPGIQRVALADSLRELAAAIDPIILPRERRYEQMRYTEVVARYGYDEAKRFPEFRRFLQRLGAEGGREVLGQNVWVDALERRINRIEPGVPVVVTDVRFLNEADWIQEHGELWHVRRLNADGTQFDNGMGTEHQSEQHVEELYRRADFALQARSLDDLAKDLAFLISRRTHSGRVPLNINAGHHLRLAQEDEVFGVPV